ncbi:nitronate monooxygenase [uncultured Microbacterium sp.]|uniref:nitronate monooxygenase n=1 Tax=uncultured Microbacterium sp. TaxID=191216 RepID=UPI0035CA0FCE
MVPITPRREKNSYRTASKDADTLNSPLTALGVSNPVLAAPMAGGPSTSEFVVATGRSRSLGFVAAGYKDIATLTDQIATVRASGLAFAVNLFAPNPVPISPDDYRDYARLLQPEADTYGIDLGAIGLREDTDLWDEKVALMLADPVAVVSFTFGIPSPLVISGFRKAGTVTIQTVTSVDEARLAAEAGVDMLAVQASAAGGHSGTLTPGTVPPAIPLADLLGAVAAAVQIPIIAAGGITTADGVTTALRAGAAAVSVGTVLLRADESGASTAHKAALADPAFDATVVTRAFTGRPARALRNGFTERHAHTAPLGYPAVHFLTSPIRKAGAAAGDTERIHLWAGTGYRDATAEPLARILARLASTL